MKHYEAFLYRDQKNEGLLFLAYMEKCFMSFMCFMERGLLNGQIGFSRAGARATSRQYGWNRRHHGAPGNKRKNLIPSTLLGQDAVNRVKP